MPLGNGTGPPGAGGGGAGRGGGRGRQPGGFGLGPGGGCRCANHDCGYKEPHIRGIPCYEKVCPKCGARLIRG